MRDQASRVQEEINEIEAQFANHRDNVIQMLLDSVMTVQLDVPRVVKQNFVVAAEEWGD